jgi:hypothetical protein
MKMLEVQKSYKHENCRDVAIFVAYLTETDASVLAAVHWVNVVGPRHFILGSEEITIKREDLDKWKPFEVKFQ